MNFIITSYRNIFEKKLRCVYPGGTNNRATLFKIEEINPTTNQIVKTRTIENSVVATVKSYSLTCDGGCPAYTCEVDCGDKICCYGSDGIARDFYYK